jgi:hypothetical protein
MVNSITEVYKGRKIKVDEEDSIACLSIEGKDIPYVTRNGRYWSRFNPYLDFSSLNALAKSIIDLSLDIKQKCGA